MQPLKITVTDMTGLNSLRPAKGGVPLARGAAPEAAQFTLLDDDARPVACQATVLARWEDDSARWVLLDFLSEPPANGVRTYTLQCGDEVTETAQPQPATVSPGPAPSLSSGDMEITTTGDGLLRIADRLQVSLVATDSDGVRYEAQAESVDIETAGPVRSTLALQGSFESSAGDRLFTFRMWVSVFAGLSKVRLEPLILIDSESGVVQRVQDLSLQIRPLAGVRSATIGGDPGWQGEPETAVRLLQIDDETYTLAGAAGVGEKAPGWAEFDDGLGTVAIALRDFWQQWPKSLEVDAASLTIGLLPHFEAGACDHMGPWYKHDYLFDANCYRLRTGQARRWQVWIDLDGDGEALAKTANAPLIPAADPAQAVATGVWGMIQPTGSPGMEEYDEWAANLFDAYCASIAAQRDYGAMNWGDWWGERDCNWGNHEYDTPKHMLVQFARTADPRYFHLGEISARHYSEVDVVHAVNNDLVHYFEVELDRGKPEFPSRPGMVHEHSIGHVGGFHPVQRIRELYKELGMDRGKNTYLCLDPYNLGHIFTQGMAYEYFLTGDPWVKETLDKIGANLAQIVEDRDYQFKGWSHCGRTNGWTMLALAGCHDASPSDRYLAAMRTLADDALGEQDPNCGGWLYELPPGHCNCTTAKHVGEAGFITSVRLNGLCRYHDLIGDERIPEAVRRGITHLINDTWREQDSDWRYTSCPATNLTRQFGVTVRALASSVHLTRDPEHERILRKAWATKFDGVRRETAEVIASPDSVTFGKRYGSTLYGCPEVVSLLAALDNETSP